MGFQTSGNLTGLVSTELSWLSQVGDRFLTQDERLLSQVTWVSWQMFNSFRLSINYLDKSITTLQPVFGQVSYCLFKLRPNIKWIQFQTRLEAGWAKAMAWVSPVHEHPEGPTTKMPRKPLPVSHIHGIWPCYQCTQSPASTILWPFIYSLLTVVWIWHS